MAKDKVAAALLDLNWSEFQGATPTEAVVRPQGDRKSDLVTRTRKAFRKANVRQVA